MPGASWKAPGRPGSRGSADKPPLGSDIPVLFKGSQDSQVQDMAVVPGWRAHNLVLSVNFLLKKV